MCKESAALICVECKCSSPTQTSPLGVTALLAARRHEVPPQPSVQWPAAPSRPAGNSSPPMRDNQDLLSTNERGLSSKPRLIQAHTILCKRDRGLWFQFWEKFKISEMLFSSSFNAVCDIKLRSGVRNSLKKSVTDF